MRALVTGASGFVGGYLLDALRAEGAEVFGCCGPGDRDERYRTIDLSDGATLRDALERFRPTVVFHLAAQTYVPDALRSPIETYETNVLGTARLAEAVRAYGGDPPPRIVFASSAEVYGARDAGEYPLRETLDVRPANPYGASKAAAEAILAGEARSFGTDVVIARAFNHIGPGQRESFVVASFAAQLARIAAGGAPLLLVGNLDAARDFLDVRDVAAAYVALARHGERGEIYNVCSGKAVAIRDVLRELIGIARVPVEVREDPDRMRPSEIPLSVGSPEKLRARTEWKPRIAVPRSLAEIYEAAVEKEPR
ncbi:MAG TPA: GDP-mannose 4,6-dehydratase [Candidatus Binatia bacterium]|nr:GDP-mannose 4,6-dehydratase [Candidatus Binatia bacterium]